VPHRGKHPEGSSHGVDRGDAWVYMVLCADGTLYTGWTFDLAARVEAHNLGRGARYTAGRRPVRLVFSERLPSKGDALRRELAIKRMSRQEKERLAAERIGAPLVSPGEGGL